MRSAASSRARRACNGTTSGAGRSSATYADCLERDAPSSPRTRRRAGGARYVTSRPLVDSCSRRWKSFREHGRFQRQPSELHGESLPRVFRPPSPVLRTPSSLPRPRARARARSDPGSGMYLPPRHGNHSVIHPLPERAELAIWEGRTARRREAPSTGRGGQPSRLCSFSFSFSASAQARSQHKARSSSATLTAWATQPAGA